MLSKLPSSGFYPSLCTLISNLISDCTISAVVDGYCSSSEPINSCVPQCSVLSPTLFLLFINNLSSTQSNFHTYADDSILHYFTSFSRRPAPKEGNHTRMEAVRRLFSDLVMISDWGRRNLGSLNPL